MTEEEFIESLHDRDLFGLDSEYTYSTRKLVTEFDAVGAHMNRWWVMTPVDWSCPCCKRKKSEIVRLNKHSYLTCQLHEHHDHMVEVVRSLFEDFSIKQNTVVADELSERFAIKTAFSLSAYDNTVVCFDCNKADSDAKKLVNAHKFFSFSPNEIGEFVIPTANQEHQIDGSKALAVWKKAQPVFQTRMELAKTFAKLAAEKKEWYQPSEITARQLERMSVHKFKISGVTEFNSYEPERLLYNTAPFTGENCSWRMKSNRINKKQPTTNELSHLAATRGKFWNKYDENWSCPCCKRSKIDCVRPSKKNTWVLEIKSGALFVSEKSTVDYKPGAICADCLDSALNLGREVVKESGAQILFKSSIISLSELSRIVIANPHSRHRHNNQLIDDLMPTFINRSKIIQAKEDEDRRKQEQQYMAFKAMMAQRNSSL